MQGSACAWRLSIVLREVRYPAQKWMILTTADTYGADVQTRIELQDLPEATYHSGREAAEVGHSHDNSST